MVGALSKRVTGAGAFLLAKGNGAPSALIGVSAACGSFAGDALLLPGVVVVTGDVGADVTPASDAAGFGASDEAGIGEALGDAPASGVAEGCCCA